MKKVVIAGMVGNGLEWYDYALYGQVAWLLAQLFFPKGDPVANLLATFAVFAAGFLVRPLGAVFFGWLGDRYGRRRAMVAAILMMAIPTGCIGILPTYDEIGILAPIMLTVIRLLQGLSLGGEFSGSITYIVEHAPAHRRGLAGSASLVSLMLGFVLGLLVVRGLIGIIGQEEFVSWGWRLPFILGIVIGLVGFYIRNHCEESPIYEQARKEETISLTPVRQAFRDHPWEMLQGFGAYMTVTMPFYLTAIYFISFTQTHLGIASHLAMNMSIINMLAMACFVPISAWLSDRIGRKPVMMTACVAVMLAIHPIFATFQPGQDVMIVGLAQFTLAVLLGLYMGPIAALLVELFPTSVRFSGMAIAYNLSAAIFGGSAPWVCEKLIELTGADQSIAWYVMACNVASLTALWFYKDRYKEALR
ncbi:MAG: MFS transporter [Rickettsiales bacterium]|nr:MFS transporter [Rickettsiales bacterium]